MSAFNKIICYFKNFKIFGIFWGFDNVSARNCSQTTKEQANTISINKIKKNRFFRVLVVQFVNKRVKTHKAKTDTKSCNNKILRCIIYEA